VAKIGFVSRTRDLFGGVTRAVRSVGANERAASFGRQAKKHLRALKRRLGLFDEDTFEDEEEARQRRRAREMIGLGERRAQSELDPYATGDEVTAPMAELTDPMAELTDPMGDGVQLQMTRERVSSSTFTVGQTMGDDDEREPEG
jgi:hypothetical protein